MKELAGNILLLNKIIESNKNEFTEKAYKNLRYHFDLIIIKLAELKVSQTLYYEDEEYLEKIIELEIEKKLEDK